MTSPAIDRSPTEPRVITGPLYRVQRGHRKRFAAEPPPAPVHRPARIAIMLALAHKLQQAIDGGHLRDRAEAARRLGLTRARITQLLDLTLLAADIQEHLLALEAIDGIEPLTERALRSMTRSRTWQEQRTLWKGLAMEGQHQG